MKRERPEIEAALLHFDSDLPRRCAITEIANGRLVGIPVAGVSRRRQVMLVCRRAHRSHAADAFLEVAQEKEKTRATI